jgi:hypothetical protein
MDLHELHKDFINLKCGKHVDYMAFLDLMDAFGTIAPQDKADDYKAYVLLMIAE